MEKRRGGRGGDIQLKKKRTIAPYGGFKLVKARIRKFYSGDGKETETHRERERERERERKGVGRKKVVKWKKIVGLKTWSEQIDIMKQIKK